MFFLGFTLAFALVHSTLYAFDRRETGNLYLAISSASFCLFLWAGTTRIIEQDLATTIQILGISSMIVAFILFGQRFVKRSSPPIIALFVAVAVLAVVSQAVFESSLVLQLFVPLSLVELVRLLVAGHRQSTDPRGWLVGLGFLAILVAAGLETLSDLELLPALFRGIYPYGMLFLFVALSMYLSLRFADTRRSLERRLVEVETLSQGALEQERQAQARASERLVLEKDLELKQRELEAARDLQLSLLPKVPSQLDHLELLFEMRTASEVGGDYYDFRHDADGSVTVAIGDASGHGLDAGLLVGATKGLFQAAGKAPTLLEQLELIARGFAGIRLQRRFMALTMLRFADRELHVVSAGMPPVLIARAADGTVEEIAAENPPLGILPGHQFEASSVRLGPGDTVLATSDGLAERLNASSDAFGYDALMGSFSELCQQDLDQAKRGLFAAVDDWAQGIPRGDDETLVLVRLSRYQAPPERDPS